MTIRTVTLSPGFDHVVRVRNLTPGGVGQVLAWETNAAGKGVNVARDATALGGSCVAYTLVGVVDQDEFVQLITETGSAAVTVAVPGRTRNNLTLEVDDQGILASHATGPRLVADNEHADRLIAQLVDQVEVGDVVTFNGAIPEAVRSTIWAEAAVALGGGVTVIADVQGDALVALVSTGIVTMAKPNEDEARALPGVAADATADEAAAMAIAFMRQHGVSDPIVSVGERGVVHLRDDALTRSWCPAPEPRVLVGAGDAFVAGYCAALDTGGWADIDALSLGLASASVHVAGRPLADRARDVREAIGLVLHTPAT